MRSMVGCESIRHGECIESAVSGKISHVSRIKKTLDLIQCQIDHLQSDRSIFVDGMSCFWKENVRIKFFLCHIDT